MLVSRVQFGWLPLAAVVCTAPLIAAERYVPVAVSRDESGGVPGYGFLSFGPPSINESGQVAFAATMAATADPTQKGSGVWVGAPGEVAVVAATGSTPTGLAEAFTSIFLPTSRAIPLNDRGEVAFIATTASSMGPSVSNQGLWKGDSQSTTRLYRSDDAAPEAGQNWTLTKSGGLFANPTYLLNDRGDVLFSSWLINNSSSPNDWRRVLWLTPDGGQRQLIAAEAPIGGPLGVATIPSYYPELPVISPDGEVTFAAFGPPNAVSSYRLSVAVRSEEGVTVQAMSGEPAPGLPGLTLTSISLDSSAGEGAVSVQAQLSDGRRGLWVLGPNGLETRLIAGDPVPGGAPGEVIDEFFYESVVNAHGVVAAYGGTRVGTSGRKTGVWLSDSSGYRMVAAQGEPAPGNDGLFSGFIRSEPVLNSRGQIAFLGSVGSSPMFSGIWATNAEGDLVKIVKAGDQVEVAPGDVRTVQSLQFAVGSGGDDGRPSSFNDIGQIVYSATFTDSTSAVLLSEAVAHLDADYNADGVVDQADYEVWRGAYSSGLSTADGNSDGSVDAADYTLWRDQLGARLFTFQAGAAVPEPTMAALAILTAAAWLSSPRRRG